uniref:Uncharacterized protein n=1 Tax=Octopus bimaculoides TaxID=37653 RepID=A0A0L8H174_OCTBM
MQNINYTQKFLHFIHKYKPYDFSSCMLVNKIFFITMFQCRTTPLNIKYSFIKYKGEWNDYIWNNHNITVPFSLIL